MTIGRFATLDAVLLRGSTPRSVAEQEVTAEAEAEVTVEAEAGEVGAWTIQDRTAHVATCRGLCGWGRSWEVVQQSSSSPVSHEVAAEVFED